MEKRKPKQITHKKRIPEQILQRMVKRKHKQITHKHIPEQILQRMEKLLHNPGQIQQRRIIERSLHAYGNMVYNFQPP